MTDHDYMKKAVTKKSRNTKYCCVPQCGTYGDTGISFHLFPKNIELKKKWEIALRMGKPASSAMKVCSRHFKATDYFRNNTQRQKLFPHAIPSANITKKSRNNKKPLAKKIKKIAQKIGEDIRQAKSVETKEDLGLVIEIEKIDSPDRLEDNNISENTCRVILMSSSTQANLADFRVDRPQDNRSIADFLCDKEPLEKCTQINFLPLWQVEKSSANQATLSDILCSDMNLFTFTGIHTIELLETLVSCVSELALDALTNKKILSVRDRVILTMVKIKQNMSFTDIGVLFGINRQTCSNYFNNMCPMLNRVLKVVIPWPDSRSVVHTDFDKTVIEKCECLKCQVLTYSQYKNTSTAKFYIGITLSGLITEIGTSYRGGVTDKYSDNETEVLDDCEFNDGVIVDKGYRIEFECNQHLRLGSKSPSTTQKNHIVTNKVCTAETAQAKVHIKRVIQRLRQYKLLCGPLPWSLAPYFDDILNIVGGLINLGPPIINK